MAESDGIFPVLDHQLKSVSYHPNSSINDSLIVPTPSRTRVELT